MSTTTTASPPRAATRRPCSIACSTACACASGEPANETTATGESSAQSPASSGRTPASTTSSSRPSRPESASAIARASSVLPARGAPQISTREPLPNGVSHSTALSVTSSESSARRSDGQATGSSSNLVPSATSSAGRPLIVSTRTSEGKRSERRGPRTGPPMRSPDTSSQRLTWAAET